MSHGKNVIISIRRDDLIAFLLKPQNVLCNHESAITYLRNSNQNYMYKIYIISMYEWNWDEGMTTNSTTSNSS
jgi:hypothetical protein